jgi:transcriptional regulator with XRE-family HTH domain
MVTQLSEKHQLEAIKHLHFVGKALKAMRENRKITIEELSEATGLSQTIINNIECGSRPIDVYSLVLS